MDVSCNWRINFVCIILCLLYLIIVLWVCIWYGLGILVLYLIRVSGIVKLLNFLLYWGLLLYLDGWKKNFIISGLILLVI